MGGASAPEYLTSTVFYDGLGRERQRRTPFLAGDGILRQAVTLQTFTALGQPYQSFAPYTETFSLVYHGTGWAERPHTTSSYDALGRLVALTDVDGTVTRHFYGVGGSGAAAFVQHDVVDPKRHRQQFRYDAHGQLLTSIQLAGNCNNRYAQYGYPCGPADTPWHAYATLTYSYNVRDEMLSTLDNARNATLIEYDLAGRKRRLDDPDMGVWHYGYDPAGNLTTQLDARGQLLCFAYDALNRMTAKWDAPAPVPTGAECPSVPPNPAVRYEYDDPTVPYGKGQRSAMYDPSGHTRWQYDARGRLLTETKVIQDDHLSHPQTFVTTWRYDAAGRIRQQRYPADNQGTLGERLTVQYPPHAPLPTGLAGGSTYAQGMTYNVWGQLTQIQYGTNPLTPQHLRYHPLTEPGGKGRLRALLTPHLQALAFEYDAISNVTTIQDGNTCNGPWATGCHRQHFAYDELDRLVRAETSEDGLNTVETYQYDSLGNLTEKAGIAYAYQGDAPHAVTHLKEKPVFGYDPNGNLLSRSAPHDDLFVYDAENRLSEVRRVDHTGERRLLASFRYDGDGNRVQMSVYQEGFAGVVMQRTTYAGAHLEVTQSHGTWGSSPPAYTWYYHIGGRRVALRQGTDTPLWLLADHLGSTSVTVDSSGNRHSHLRYSPWGETLEAWGSPPTAHRFTGQPLDPTGLYFFQSRYYDPALARFLQPDTLIPDPATPQAFNRFAYVLNNPLKYVDPTGHCAGYPGSGQDVACWQAYDEAINQLGFIPKGLAQWSRDQLNNLLYWLAAGVRFISGAGTHYPAHAAASQWTGAEIGYVLDALNAVEQAVGNKTRAALGLTNGGLLPIKKVWHSAIGGTYKVFKDGSQPNYIVLYLNGANNGRAIMEIAIHELGHAVDWHAGDGEDFFSESFKWMGPTGWLSCGEDCWQTKSNSVVSERHYAATDPREDFAYSFVFFVLGENNVRSWELTVNGSRKQGVQDALRRIP